MRFRIRMITAVLLSASALVSAQPAKPAPDDLIGDLALSERIAQLAQITLASSSSMGSASLRQTTALLEAAIKLNPTEVRFHRLLIEAYLQLGGKEGREGAIASLTRYRALEPNDQGAQIQLIDLYYSQKETAEDRKKYLEQLLQTTSLPFELRAHVAVQAARLAEDRTETELAKQYVDQALSLSPLSQDALQMKYRALDNDATVVQHEALLLQMLRSNPAQPAVMMELASELAGVGLVDPAMNWYQQAFALMQRQGMSPNSDQFTAYGSELIIADQLTTAASFARNLYERDATNSDAAFLLLLVAKRSGDKDKLESALTLTRAAIFNSIGPISDKLNTRNSASTTRPDGTFDVDVQADVKKLGEQQNPNLSFDYAEGLASLAWLEIYFNGKPGDAQQYLTALSQLVPADSVMLTRLEGWAYLVDGKPAEAKVKLSAVADRDPLAALGMLRVNTDAPPDQINASASKLLMENSSGLVGAILMEALRDRVGLMPQSADAPAVRAELDKFPKDWLDILDFSRVMSFYQLKAEAERVAHAYGVPMLAKVTITNIGKYDITVGPQGVIRPDLWFDVQVKGLAPQFLQGIAFDRLSQKSVLRPRESMSMTVRIDQGPLSTVLQTSPQVALPLYFSVMTNPVTLQNGIAPGPGGYRASMRVIERSASPPTAAAMQSSFSQLQSGNADVRMRTLELLGGYSRALLSSDDAAMHSKGAEIADVVRKSIGDGVPAVRAQAMYITALLSDGGVRDAILRQMLMGRSLQERIVGLNAIQQALDGEKRKVLAGPLAESDPDPVAKKLAASVIELADIVPSSTQPATQPASPALI